MKKLTSNADFWITNISNRNVSLADLNLTIKAFSSINLMDKKHYDYTLDQLQKSASSGSISIKSSIIKVRKYPPLNTINNTISISKETFIPSREQSILNIKEENYEELKVEGDLRHADEEKFAAENADLAELDTQPQIVNVKR